MRVDDILETTEGENNDNQLSNRRNTNRKHSGGGGDSRIVSDDDNRRKPVGTPLGTPLGTFEATMYTAKCEGCSGVTRYGLDVRSTIYSPKGLRVIAVDPSVIEPMTIVKIKFSSGRTITAVAGDIGSLINGAEIDILVGSRGKAMDFGRQAVEITKD